MNTRTLYRIVVCTCLLLSSFIPQNYVYAQESDFAEIPLEAFHDEKPIELVGLTSSQTLNIAIPQSWLIGEKNWMEIQLSVSPVLDAARSSITIALNDSKMVSYSLSKIPGTKQRILIPPNMLTQGNNTLSFTSTLYLPNDSETNCQNWDDPSRWLTVEPGGLLHLSFERRDPAIDLSSFPQIFVEPLETYLPDPMRKQTLIVLPKNSTQDDLTSLSTISYLLGHHAGSRYEWSPEIIDFSEWDRSLAANRNMIFIHDMPTEIQDKTGNQKDFVGLFPSPWGTGNAVMVIGDQDRQDGFTPASVFSDPTRSILLRGNTAYVDRQPLTIVQPFQKKYSFEELGYVDRTVRGVGQQSLIYRLYIPYDVEPVLAKLKLDLFHSPNLNTQNSFFTVYLNGNDIAAILPGARGSIEGPITIGLPDKRFRPGLNFIRVSFDLHVSRSSCEHSLESVWGTVLSSSTIEMISRKRTPTPSLEYFPLPFSDPPGSLIVIPDRFQQDDLTQISKLSFMMGASAYQAHRPPEVTTAANFMPEDSRHPHIILVGGPHENSVTYSINDLLPQPFSRDGSSLQPGYGIQLPTRAKQASLGVVEILPSPWVRGGTVLMLTGNDLQGLEWTWNSIMDPTLHDRFAGNVMVVGYADGNQTIDGGSADSAPLSLFQQVADASNIPIIGPLLQKSGQAFVAPALAAVGSALLVVIGIYWIINLTKHRRKPL